jgi:hypothetical protein
MGWAAMVMAGSVIIFVVMFTAVYPAAGIQGGDFSSAEIFLPFAHDNLALAVVPFGVGILMHLAGFVLVVGLWSRLRHRSEWLWVTAALGLTWMAFDTAYNGIAIHVIPALSQSVDPSFYASYDVLTTSLGALQLTGHLAGGLWLATTSLSAMREGMLTRRHGWLGFATGVVFALSILGPNVLYPSFVLLPVWLGWYGLRAVRGEGSLPKQTRVVSVES